MQVWALAVGSPCEGVVATGGGDGTVVLWEDCTTQDAAAAAKEQQEAVLREQDLLNALQVLGMLGARASYCCGQACSWRQWLGCCLVQCLLRACSCVHDWVRRKARQPTFIGRARGPCVVPCLWSEGQLNPPHAR